ncbi:MAG: pilus assembly protein PilM [Candidatus Omnitrophota bacterium]|nr:MAG: pilus assembly protein PilM [Candidatus Omnitrophota bacterium]
MATNLTKIMELFKKDYIIGLDIGTSSVKMAQFTKKEDGLYLVKAEIKEIASPLSRGLASSECPGNDAEILPVLKDLFRGIDVKKSKIIVIINCPKTSMKAAKIPYMPKTELRNAINLEAKNYFPLPADDSSLDYEILGDIVEKGVRKYEVAVAVSPKKTVNRYLSLLGKAGIKPHSFIPYDGALQKLAEHSYPKEDKTACFLVMSELYTELAIFKGKSLMFSRKIPVTGRDITKAMTGVLASDKGKIKLSMEEAEKIKREVGIPAEGDEAKIIDGKISTVQILSMLRMPLEQLVSEVERCFDYYREESDGGTVDSLALFGGGASLGGLIKFLSERLGIEISLGDALRGLNVEKDAVKERHKISHRLGLAIGASLTEGKGINLLPPEIKEEVKRIVKRGMIEVIITVVIIISLLLYIGMKIELSNLQKRSSVARFEISSLQPQLKRAEAHHLASMVLVDEPYWEDVFKELSNLIFPDIYLTNMKLERGIIIMKGVVASEDAESILSNFMLTLEKGIFRNVKLVRTRDLKDKSGTEFELKCELDRGKD